LEHFTAYVELTTACMLKCPHCHIPERLRSQPAARRTFKEDLMRLISLGVNRAVYSGGEPTLHPFLPEIVEEATERLNEVSVISNAINPALLKALSKRCRIWVSVDYYGEKHDEQRGFKGLWRNYLSLSEIADVRSTLLRNNLQDIKKLIEICEEKSRKITIVPYKNTNPHLTPTPRNLTQLLKYIFTQGYAKTAVVDEPLIRFFLLKRSPEKLSLLEKEGGACPALKTVIGLTAQGTVTPCPFSRETVEHIETPTPKLLEAIAKHREKFHSKLSPKCERCTYKQICGGCKKSNNTYCFIS